MRVEEIGYITPTFSDSHMRKNQKGCTSRTVSICTIEGKYK